MLAMLRLLRKVQALGDLPWIEDEAALRAWLTGLARIGVDAADDTPETTDDELVEAMQNLVADDDAWDTVYTLLVHFKGE